MQRKPGLVGRILATLVLVIGVSACAQILGNDFQIDEDAPIGGGDCDENCAGCGACALDTECEFERDECMFLGCEPFGDCCANCPTSDCDSFECDCSGKDARHFARDSCILSVCGACGGNVASVGVGGT
jgi:hypothetical protein